MGAVTPPPQAKGIRYRRREAGLTAGWISAGSATRPWYGAVVRFAVQSGLSQAYRNNSMGEASGGQCATQTRSHQGRMLPLSRCPDGETGRRKRLKISRGKPLAGSIPAPGTTRQLVGMGGGSIRRIDVGCLSASG